MTKKWYQSKTMLINIFTASIAALAMYLPMLEGVLPAEAYAVLLFVSSAGNMVLRKVTSTAIG